MGVLSISIYAIEIIISLSVLIDIAISIRPKYLVLEYRVLFHSHPSREWGQRSFSLMKAQSTDFLLKAY